MNVIDSKYLVKKDCAEALLRISGRSSMPLNYMLVEVKRTIIDLNQNSKHFAQLICSETVLKNVLCFR